MCTIQDINFTKNGSSYVPYCSVTTADNIGAEVIVSITEAPINITCMFQVQYPDGTYHAIFSNNGNRITVVNNGTITLQITTSDGLSTSTPGTYSIYSATILNETKSATLCYGTIVGNCNSLTVASSTQQTYECSGSSCVQSSCTYGSAGCYIVSDCAGACGPCQPPGGVQRYCQDANTICVWNQVSCTYDCSICSTNICQNGMCTSPGGGTGYNCSGSPNYQCTQAPSGTTGQYSTPDLCTAVCKAVPSTGGCSPACISTQMCVAGSCYEKSTVYILAVGFFALMMMR